MSGRLRRQDAASEPFDFYPATEYFRQGVYFPIRQACMKDKTWTLDYQGHQIVVVYRLSIFPPRTSEALMVDG